jgi:DNA-binding transcriptional LysR family regulator
MPAMQWDDVRVLLALLRTANLGDAATRLHVDRSTVSRRLAALEKAVGGRLFVRTRDGLRPTAAAERLRIHAEKMELDATTLEIAAKATDQRAAGVVRVATTEAMATWLVSDGLLALRNEHPDLVIELLAGNRSVDLERGEADVALRLSPVRGATLRVRRVARHALGLFASPAYTRARGLARSPSALSGHDVLLPSGELSRLPEVRWLATRPGVRVVLRSSSMPALLAAAIAGWGIIPMALGWGDKQPGLERVMVLDHVPKRAVWLVSLAEASSRPAVRVVAERIAMICTRSASV